jgi:hypothetical protein
VPPAYLLCLQGLAQRRRPPLGSTSCSLQLGDCHAKLSSVRFSVAPPSRTLRGAAGERPLSSSAAHSQLLPNDLAVMKIGDLMNVEVTSVSRHGLSLSQTAAAVFVITREDIRRSGATNIPDLLRCVPGLQVAQINASAWASARAASTNTLATNSWSCLAWTSTSRSPSVLRNLTNC